MAVREIVRFPDPRLRQAAAAVTRFDGELAALAQDLLETLRAAPGIGITAPHIGVGLRLVVLELPEDGQVQIYANPRITWSSSERGRHPEGSVSMPGVVDEVERPKQVRVQYQDLDGPAQESGADGLLAVCLQHEIDQLDGIFWLQKLSRLRRERVVKRFEKLARAASGA
ncbi:peptide deformylase [Roseixanthobacter liquoris]|uniref:peptide deformylase n=1 Tax=Roseixanthobacter liquoris TaxID=3119921 RepID=UPI0037271ED3